MEAKFFKSVAYGNFSTGKEIISGTYRPIAYWRGQNSIRETKESLFVCIAGQDTINGSRRFIERVYKVEKTAANIKWLTEKIDRLEFVSDNEWMGSKTGKIVSQVWA